MGWAASAALVIAGIACMGVSATSAFAAPADNSANTTTPIKHVVVMFGENISYDHYFGTYPNAANTDGTTFTAAAGTPTSTNYVSDPSLLTANPNTYNPKRLAPAQAVTCDQNHNYGPEQVAVDSGAMDKFVPTSAGSACTPSTAAHPADLVMDYYDGNTVTGLWNYAQNYAMSDNSWDTTFGPSTPGALNLVSGQTHGATAVDSITGAVLTTGNTVASPNAQGVGTVIGDPDPSFDDCSDNDHTSTNPLVKMQGANIGDLLNTRNVTWGWFQGGFAPTTAWDGTAGHYAACDKTTANVGGAASKDYSPHHSPFQYYASTSNPHHLPPTSDAMIGHTDQANHQYDLASFSTALSQNNLPAVSYLKAPEAQDGHPGYSDPLDEQKFLINQINAIEKSPSWSSTAIVINYDDSDGWYDQAAPTILNGSTDAANDSATCTSGPAPAGGYLDRCGPSQRLPLVVISPYSKVNFIDHTATEQTSVLKFVEDNWSTGRIGDSSFDARAGTINSMFDFADPQTTTVTLAADGSVISAAGAITPVAASTAGPGLAATGANATVPVIVGIVLIIAGVVLFVLRRRSRRQHVR